ncbi:hypothetical protein VNO80_15711 [Phaseolus coccineus]|uniref:Uncharacterized protein n=1 Tax=Phaseolus coccineus TaxID=3886 RepID=A0AAN9MP79_PHACN
MGDASVVCQGETSVVCQGETSVVCQGETSVVCQGETSVVYQGETSVVCQGEESVVRQEEESVIASMRGIGHRRYERHGHRASSHQWMVIARCNPELVCTETHVAILLEETHTQGCSENAAILTYQCYDRRLPLSFWEVLCKFSDQNAKTEFGYPEVRWVRARREILRKFRVGKQGVRMVGMTEIDPMVVEAVVEVEVVEAAVVARSQKP